MRRSDIPSRTVLVIAVLTAAASLTACGGAGSSAAPGFSASVAAGDMASGGTGRSATDLAVFVIGTAVGTTGQLAPSGHGGSSGHTMALAVIE